MQREWRDPPTSWKTTLWIKWLWLHSHVETHCWLSCLLFSQPSTWRKYQRSGRSLRATHCIVSQNMTLPILLSMKPVYLETWPSSCLGHFSYLSILQQLADLSNLWWAALSLSLSWNKAYHWPLPTLLHSKLLWSCSPMMKCLALFQDSLLGVELWTEHRLQVEPATSGYTVPFILECTWPISTPWL